MLGCGFWWSGLTAFLFFNMSFLVEDVKTTSKPQSLPSVRINECTLRVPNKTTTLFLLWAIIKAIFIHLGQSTHQDFIKKSSLRRILFDKSCLQRILFHEIFGLRRMFFIKNVFFSIILGCVWFVSYSVYQFIGGENDSREAFKRSASVDIICVTRHDRDSGEQTTWIRQSLPQRYVYVGCQLNSDQALRLHCLKGHVRARDSTLWGYRWHEASELLCTKINLFGGSWATKKIAKKTPEMLSPTRY